MAITITHHPNGLILAKNTVHFAGQTDNFIQTSGVKQYAAFLIANNCEYDFSIEFTFPNKLGNNTLSKSFAIKGYNFYGITSDYINNYFVPKVVDVLNADATIAQFYDVTYTPFGTNSIVVEIEAKQAGTLYNFDILVTFTALLGTFPPYDISEPGADTSGLFYMTDGAEIVYRDNLVIQCTVQKYNMTDNTWNDISRIKCLPTKDNGSFLFNLSGVLLSALNYTISYVKPIPAEYKQFGFFRFVFDEVIAGVQQNATYSHESYAILGASPQPNRRFDTNRFFTETKHPFLTNMPAKARFGRDVYFTFGFMLGNIFNKADVYYKLSTDATVLQLVSENKNAETKMYFFKYSQCNYAAKYEQLVDLNTDLLEKDACTLLIANEHYTDTPTEEIENPLEVIIDLKKYRNNNYFLFANALGGTDTAWLSGELEYATEIDVTKIEYAPVLDADFQILQFGMNYKKGTHKFKINTGFKSIAEIQWLLELVYSESVVWAPHKIWRNMIDAANNVIAVEEMDGPIPVIIDKQSITYHKSNNMVNAFSFEFEIAADNYAPHLNLI